MLTHKGAINFWWILICIAVAGSEFCIHSDKTKRCKRDTGSTLEKIPQLLSDFVSLFSTEDYTMAKQILTNIIGNLERFLDQLYIVVNTINGTQETEDGKVVGAALEKMNHFSGHTSLSFDKQYQSTVQNLNQLIALFSRYCLHPDFTNFVLMHTRCKKLMPNFSLHWISRYLSRCCFLKNLVRSTKYNLIEYMNFKKQVVYDSVKGAMSSEMCLGLATVLQSQSTPSSELIANQKNHAIRDIHEIMENLNEFEHKLITEFNTDTEYGLTRTIQDHFNGKQASQETVSGLYQKLSKLYSYVNWAVLCLNNYHAEGKFISIESPTCDAVIHFTRSSLKEQTVNMDRLKNAIKTLDKSYSDVRSITINLTEILKPTGQQMILTFVRDSKPKSISKMHITQRYDVGKKSFVIVFA